MKSKRVKRDSTIEYFYSHFDKDVCKITRNWKAKECDYFCGYVKHQRFYRIEHKGITVYSSVCYSCIKNAYVDDYELNSEWDSTYEN